MLVSIGYVAHGGSGLAGYDWNVAREMPVRDLIWCLEWLRDQREAEADAIRKAHRRK